MIKLPGTTRASGKKTIIAKGSLKRYWLWYTRVPARGELTLALVLQKLWPEPVFSGLYFVLSNTPLVDTGDNQERF
jgi:hypothetical protein